MIAWSATDLLALALSVITIVQMWLAGSGHRLTWVVGLPNQTAWCAWCVLSGNVGILPLNLILWAVYLRNLWRTVYA